MKQNVIQNKMLYLQPKTRMLLQLFLKYDDDSTGFVGCKIGRWN